MPDPTVVNIGELNDIVNAVPHLLGFTPTESVVVVSMRGLRERLELCLRVATPMVAGTTFDRERMAGAAADELVAATDVADLLVRRGTPFREAHGIVGGLVREALASGRPLSELSSEELEDLAPGLDPTDLRELVTGGGVLESKISAGGTSQARVREQLDRARAALAEP